MKTRTRPLEVVDLFVLLARRPHPGCVRAQRPQVQFTRLASTRTSLPTIAEKSGIPLNVGLDRNPDHVSAISRIPIPKGVKGEVFTPSVLSRPLGLRNPPKAGDNSPQDKRTWKERSRDFSDPEKAKIRQRVLLRSYFRPYYQERNRASHFGGKSFVSNNRLFRREKALYFPNIFGRTLSKEGDGPDGGRNLAPLLLNGKISIISMESADWARKQVETFVSPKANPALESIIDASSGMVQRVTVNMQDSVLNMWLVRLFQYRIRQQIPADRWSKYFVIQLPRDIRKGLTEDVRDAMGLLNSQVGYVYLVDSEARIRWAGSGDAWDGEVAGMNAAIQRLLEEERSSGRLGKKASQTDSAPQQEDVRNMSRPDRALM